MKNGKAINISNWMRRRQAGIAILLTLTVLFNTATAFAFSTHRAAPETDATMLAHTHEMQSPCCPDQSQNHNTCCQGAGCACLAQCATLLFSLPLTAPQNLFKQTMSPLAENLPITHVDPPPQRPPRV